jgi:hypothetical protein
MNATLQVGDGTQTAARVRACPVGEHRPARTHMPRNMKKNVRALGEMRNIRGR